MLGLTVVGETDGNTGVVPSCIFWLGLLDREPARVLI